ncbi:unnamed protein product [Heligmosomoides polygyrus]|uniref:Uncharacterized protein n=1 Tax=Heligmosomoides polygyrus TaxID=6339 RepID=A0A3P8CEW3_HELPZ|nr:unnamed protein product [Heligmosomoides polygyrus]
MQKQRARTDFEFGSGFMPETPRPCRRREEKVSKASKARCKTWSGDDLAAISAVHSLFVVAYSHVRYTFSRQTQGDPRKCPEQEEENIVDTVDTVEHATDPKDIVDAVEHTTDANEPDSLVKNTDPTTTAAIKAVLFDHDAAIKSLMEAPPENVIRFRDLQEPGFESREGGPESHSIANCTGKIHDCVRVHRVYELVQIWQSLRDRLQLTREVGKVVETLPYPDEFALNCRNQPGFATTVPLCD